MGLKSGLNDIAVRLRSMPGAGYCGNNRQLVFLVTLNAILLLLFACCYSVDYLRANFNKMLEFVFSLQFLFFGCSGALLLYKKLSEKMYSTALFTTCFAYFYLFHGHQQHVLSLRGDNLCQIAYWEILFHPNLTGSIGASFTKPGQLVIMGLLYELNALLGDHAFSVGMCLVMAFCVWSLARIASDIGGRIAGIIVFPVSSAVFMAEFMHGSYSIFLIPVLFSGIRYYFYCPERKSLGRFLLLFSIQFHIQAVALLGTIWGILLVKKEWKELLKFSGLGVLSLALWVSVILRVQGTLDRLNCGAAVGYIASYNDFDGDFAPGDKLGYFICVAREGFEANYYYIIPLAVLAVLGIAGCFRYGFKQYLTTFSAIILLLFNVLVLGGDFNFERYFALFYAFAVSAGIGMIVRFVLVVKRERRLLSIVFSAVTVLALVMVFDFSLFRRFANVQAQMFPFVVSASKILEDNKIPESTRLMTEDDLLYPLVVLQPDRYPKLTALQYFNVAPEPERKRILAETDYIWISINARHMYYYLDYLPEPAWLSDPFRLMVIDIIQEQKPRFLYGYWFVPVDIDYERLILKVENMN
ncbi:MAG: hypothetical protein Q7V04_13325 [Deltaproteobacteria bacterium]|nr:hypothetical protein [Deltaproteobacteria bacterium]